jgi:hypothetical protein
MEYALEQSSGTVYQAFPQHGRSVANLLSLPAIGAEATVRQYFTQLLKGAPAVRDTYFPGMPSSENSSDAAFLNDVASLLVSLGIARGFGDAASLAKVDALLLDKLTSDTARGIGQNLYLSALLTCCGDERHRLIDYMCDRPHHWASELADALTAPDFLNAEADRALAGHPGWPARMHLSLHKLHLLDPARVPQVVAVWRQAFPTHPEVADRSSANYFL